MGLLLGGGTVATLASIIYPVSKFLIPPPSGEANVSQLKLAFTRNDLEREASRSKLFRFGRTLGIIFLAPSGELKALEGVCTHLDCTVQHRPDLGIIWCACHNGRYDHDGGNISGPPPRPLTKFKVDEIGIDIFVSREDV